MSWLLTDIGSAWPTAASVVVLTLGAVVVEAADGLGATVVVAGLVVDEEAAGLRVDPQAAEVNAATTITVAVVFLVTS